MGIPVQYATIFPLLALIPAVAFLILFLREAIKTRQTMFGFLAILFGVFVFQHYFNIQQYFLTEEGLANLFFVSSQVCEISIILVFSIIVETFEKSTPYSGKQLIFTILAAMTMGGMFFNPALITQPAYGTFIARFDPNSFLSGWQATFLFIAFIWLIVTIYPSYRSAMAYRQKELVKSLFYGTIFTMLIGAVVPNIVEFGVTRGIIDFDVTYIGVFEGVFEDIGMLVVGAAFLRVSKNPWLLQRQEVYFILVLSEDGVDIYSKVFNPEITPTDITLFSGGFTAVTSLFQEVTKSDTQVKSIVLEESELRFIKREHFVCAMLVDHTTAAIEVAHMKFVKDFERMFGSMLEEHDGNVTWFSDADRLADLYFA